MPDSVLRLEKSVFRPVPHAEIRPPVARGVGDPQTELHSGADAVERAATAWTALEERGATTAFQTYAMARAAARVHTARGEEIHVAVVRQDERPMALIAATVSRWCGISTLRFLGDPLIQYGDALAAPDASPQHIAHALEILSAHRVASFAWLRKVRADARLAPFLQSGAKSLLVDAAPYVDLTAGDTTRSRDARELRRCRRRLAEQGALAFAVSDGVAARPWLDQALTLKRGWLTAQGLHSRVIGDPFWEGALAAMTQQDGPARLAAAHLTCGGRTAAIEIGLIHHGCWYAFLGATDPAFAKYGPGQLQMADLMAHCRATGLKVYDLLPPAQAYKSAIAPQSVAVTDFGVALDVRGLTALYTVQFVPGLKSTISSMPLGLRRLILPRTQERETS